MSPILCLDFDGVLHSYISGWVEADFIPDPPVPGAFKFLFEACDSFMVAIYSSRSNQPGGIKAMQTWMKYWAYKELPEEQANHVWNKMLQGVITFPEHKPAAMVTIDDRAITFTGEWPSMRELRAFKPWNKK